MIGGSGNGHEGDRRIDHESALSWRHRVVDGVLVIMARTTSLGASQIRSTSSYISVKVYLL